MNFNKNVLLVACPGNFVPWITLLANANITPFWNWKSKASIKLRLTHSNSIIWGLWTQFMQNYICIIHTNGINLFWKFPANDLELNFQIPQHQSPSSFKLPLCEIGDCLSNGSLEIWLKQHFDKWLNFSWHY